MECFLNIIMLIFLVTVTKMIGKLRNQAVEAFKLNHRTTEHFRKNQYLVESLSFYLLTVICSGTVKLPLEIFFVVTKATNANFVPKHIAERLLITDIITFVMKIIIFYLPLLASQRLFKEMKLKPSAAPEAGSFIRTSTTINDDSSDGWSLKRLNTSEETSVTDSYRKLN